MSETLPGKEDGEKKAHWCLEYQELQRQLSKVEYDLGLVPSQLASLQLSWEDAWEPNNPMWDWGVRIVNPAVEEAKKALYGHRTTCDSCIKHYTQSQNS